MHPAPLYLLRALNFPSEAARKLLEKATDSDLPHEAITVTPEQLSSGSNVLPAGTVVRVCKELPVSPRAIITCVLPWLRPCQVVVDFGEHGIARATEWILKPLQEWAIKKKQVFF